MSRVLVVKMSSLGDVVHALPAAHDAVRHGHTLDWVVEESFAELPALVSGVENVIPIAWRRWRKNLTANATELRAFFSELRGREYDVVLDSQGLIKSAVVSLAARGARHGFSHTTAREPWAAFAYGARHRVARGQHAVTRQRLLFGAALNYVVDEALPVLGAASAALDRKHALFLHGTTWPAKHWPEDMWQRLIQLAHADGFTITVTGGNDAEIARATRLAQQPGVELVQGMNLTQLARVMADSAVVVGVDSGLCHLSAALGRPTLGLYGPTNASLTGPLGPQAQFLQSDLACAPCMQAQCRYAGEPQLWQGDAVQPACYAQLNPEVVWAKARSMLARAG